MSEKNHPLVLLASRFSRAASLPVLVAAGGSILLGLFSLESWIVSRVRLAQADRDAVALVLDDLNEELALRSTLRDSLARDLARAKKNAATLSRSRRELFEGSLALSEEKRLLEKQWEIMTTYLLIDVAADRVQVMRGEQAFETWPLDGAKPRIAGNVEGKNMPRIATIVSKERYAHPERGKSEVVGGRLDWEPPQVGGSARASALGEAVMFTKEGLILHGPALKRAEHESYPHLCLELPAATARRLYARSFIGTRVMIRP